VYDQPRYEGDLENLGKMLELDQNGWVMVAVARFFVGLSDVEGFRKHN
jgi:hypothetical protein